MESFSISHGVLCAKLLEFDKDRTKLKQFLQQSYVGLNENRACEILYAIYKRFYSDFKRRLQDSNPTNPRFEKKNANWLEGTFTIDFTEAECSTSSVLGRPRKSFEECCDRAKRYKRDEVHAMFLKK